MWTPKLQISDFEIAKPKLSSVVFNAEGFPICAHKWVIYRLCYCNAVSNQTKDGIIVLRN